MASYMGIDGGATRTVGVVTDDDRVVGRYVVGPTNPHVVGESGCLRELESLFEFLSHDRPLDVVRGIWIGISGVRTQSDLALMKRICERLGIADKTLLSDDLILALASASAQTCGIAVVAGTGSCVFGVNDRNDTCTAGGRGHLLGDEGSGYAIVTEAIRAASRFEQGRGSQTSLLSRFVENLGVREFDDVVRWVYNATKSDISSRAGLVFESAADGDKVARQIIERGANELAELAHHVAVALGLAETMVTVVLYGGLFDHCGSYCALVTTGIARRVPSARTMRPEVEGAVAAARLAREHTSVKTTCEGAETELTTLPVTESRNWRSAELDEVSTIEMLEIMNLEDHRVAPAVKQVLDRVARTVDLAADAIRSGGRIVYVGAGTSGRLGVLDAVECPPTFGVSPDTVQAVLAGGETATRGAIEAAEDSTENGVQQIAMRNVTGNDLVVGISAIGTAPFVKGALEEARKRGARTVLIACNPARPDFPEADVLINPVVGPEILAGSTRLKSGTATKVILNMISTGVMVRLGKVYGNLMVDVRPGSAKLARRARRIISEITGASDEDAGELLARAENNVKVAIVMKLLSVDAVTARDILAQCDGNLRKALGKQTRRSDP